MRLLHSIGIALVLLAGAGKTDALAKPVPGRAFEVGGPRRSKPLRTSGIGSESIGLAADALLAADPNLPILVPRGTGAEANEKVQRREMARLDAELAKARAARGAIPRAVVYVRASIGYGCACTPFVFDESRFANENEMWTRLGRGVPDMPRVHGDFRLAGHFTGEHITGYELHHRPPPPIRNEEEVESSRARVFAVEGWCFEPAAGPVAWYEAEDIAKMVDQGRLCRGTDATSLGRRLAKAERERKIEEPKRQREAAALARRAKAARRAKVL